MKKIVVVIALVIIFYEQVNAKEKQDKVTPEEKIAALIEGAKNGNPNALGVLGIYKVSTSKKMKKKALGY